jgi:sugar phosphate isomerase/epimerase
MRRCWTERSDNLPLAPAADVAHAPRMSAQTRRRFLRTLAATSALPFLARQSVSTASGEPAFGSGPGQFKLGTVTYNLAKDWDVPTIIKNCEATGFEAVELRTTHKHGVEPSIDAAARAEVKKRFADSKVRLLSLGTVCEFHATDPAVVKKNVETCREFLQLAHDLGCLGIKVRPNGIPKEVPEEKTIAQIGAALRECGKTGADLGVEIWVEVHGKDSEQPPRCAGMMQACDHASVGLCWNSNPADLMGGKSVKPAFELLKPWIRNCHINELWDERYPWRELFTLFREAGYQRYMLAEIPETTDPVRLMKYYRGLWRELCR